LPVQGVVALFPEKRVIRYGLLAELSLCLIIARRDERAAAVNRDDQPLVPQLSHSATHCHSGYAVLLGQIDLARQPRIRREPSGTDVSLDVPSDLSSYGHGRIVPYPVRSVIQ
jgi:hypothetical protein